MKREPVLADEPDLPAGLSSNYFHDRVEVGTKLRVGAPRGKFHLKMGIEGFQNRFLESGRVGFYLRVIEEGDPDGRRAAVLLSAGVGLTPMVRMLNAVVQSGAPRPVWFVHGALADEPDLPAGLSSNYFHDRVEVATAASTPWAPTCADSPANTTTSTSISVTASPTQATSKAAITTAAAGSIWRR